VRKLLRFTKESFLAGEEKEVRFVIHPESDFSFPDADGNKLVQPGKVMLEVGGQRVEVKMGE